MIWITASAPFWLAGSLLFSVTTVAFYQAVRKRGPDLGISTSIAIGLWLLSGAILIIAAKVAGIS